MDCPIRRRRRAGLCVAWLAVLAAGALAGCSEPVPPNVLIYTVDTLRADSLACYGNEQVATPHMDRLAAEGLRYPNAFANASWTRSSMASLFTGLYPRHHGVQGRGDALPGSLTTLGDRLGERGYTTGFITANPNAGSVFGFQHGFGEIVELYERRKQGMVRSQELIANSARITERAIEWLGRARRPFYLAVLSIDPHDPYLPPLRFDRYKGGFRGRIDGTLRNLARKDLNEAERRRLRSLYDAEVSFNDDSFGRLIEHLRASGELDNTLVVLTSDHGEEFWEYGRRGHGRSLVDPVLRIPMILRLPAGHDAPPTATAAPAELVDVLPTVLDVLGIEPSDAERLDGRSLLSASRDAKPLWASLHMDGRELEALRGERWKLVWDLADERLELFDLTQPLPEATPVPVDAGSDGAAPFEGLREELVARLQSRPAGEGDAAPEELPEDVEEALRALGYVE